MVSFSIEVRLFPPPTGEEEEERRGEERGAGVQIKAARSLFFPPGKVTAGPGVKRAQQVHLPDPPVANSTSSFVPLVWRLQRGRWCFFVCLFFFHL